MVRPPPVVHEPTTGYVVLQMASSPPKVNSETKRRRGGRALRSSISRNGPFGLCHVESFGNSFVDSASFRLPSRQSLDGRPVPPANCAPGYATPRRKSPPTRKIRKGQAAHKPVPLTLRLVQSPAPWPVRWIGYGALLPHPRPES